MLLDFVDIFNMIEILSANECGGLGSFVSEKSSTEQAIQAFCTLSFFVVLSSLDFLTKISREYDQGIDDAKFYKREEILYSLVMSASYIQNLPFLVIRIVAWARYKVYNLGFLVKNVFAIVLYFVCIVKLWKMDAERDRRRTSKDLVRT